MADNIGYTPGTGATVAADDVSGVLYQRVKLAFGADGSASDVASGSGLPVDTGLTQPLTDTYDFLDPEYHKKRLAPKVKKVINKIARQAVQKTTQDTPKEAQESSVTSDWVDSLITLLERENIAFKRFYADLLQQQIEEQRNAQIRLQLELLGIYQQIEEDDEQALIMMLMEL